MDKFPNREELIAALTEQAAPVRRIKPYQGTLLIGFATLVAAAASIVIHGFWNGLVTGEASGFFWITNGLLLVTGAASTLTLAASALPRVGAKSSGAWWSAAMLAVVPVAAVIMLVSFEATHDHSAGALADPAIWYWECAVYGLAAGLLVAIGAVLFLRRGAPVSLERVGWLTGLAAGTLGSVAYGITCPLDSIAHVGIVHVVPAALGAIAGRLVVPPLIRW